MQRIHCSGPEVIKLPHAVLFALAHCCGFKANMISPLTTVIRRSHGPDWLSSLTLCQSKLVILQYRSLFSPRRGLSKNKLGFVFAECLHENSHMLSLGLLHTSATCHLWADCPLAAVIKLLVKLDIEIYTTHICHYFIVRFFYMYTSVKELKIFSNTAL